MSPLLLSFAGVAAVIIAFGLVLRAITKPRSPAAVKRTPAGLPAKEIFRGVTVSEERKASLEDSAFEEAFESEFVAKGMVDKYFHSSIAGMNHPNEDGSSRQEIAKRCKRFDILRLIPEPTNPYDKNAVLVRTEGGVLGHLRREHAKEISSHLRYGQQWIAVVKSVGHDSPSEPMGARIVLCRLTKPWIEEQSAKAKAQNA